MICWSIRRSAAFRLASEFRFKGFAIEKLSEPQIALDVNWTDHLLPDNYGNADRS